MSAGTQPAHASLADLAAGASAVVSSIEGGGSLVHRLAALGISPGKEVHVLRKGGGPVIVRVGHTRLLLGRSMAHRIRTRPAAPHARRDTGMEPTCKQTT